MTATSARRRSRPFVTWLRHLARLIRDVAGYAVASRSWWIIPVMAALGLFAAILVASHAAVPYTIYTLF